MEIANWQYPHLMPQQNAFQSLFLNIYQPMQPEEILHAYITEETDTDSIIPQNEKAQLADQRLAQVEEFLRDITRPPDMHDAEFRQFLWYCSEFFMKNNKLWRRDPHGRHKIIVPVDKRFAIINEAHEALGHKKIYAVRIQLLERFWWPFLDHNVKWFVQSCHQCQLQQMRYHHIPPTVSAPASLFRKAYIDTMYMPRTAGFRYIVQARCSLSYPEHRRLKRETGATIGAFIFEDILC